MGVLFRMDFRRRWNVPDGRLCTWKQFNPRHLILFRVKYYRKIKNYNNLLVGVTAAFIICKLVKYPVTFLVNIRRGFCLSFVAAIASTEKLTNAKLKSAYLPTLSLSLGSSWNIAAGSSFWSPAAPQMWEYCRSFSSCSVILFLL